MKGATRVALACSGRVSAVQENWLEPALRLLRGRATIKYS